MEYISREEIEKAKDETIYGKCVPDVWFSAFVKKIDAIPTADVAPVRHGKWVEKHYGGNLYAHVCSECGAKRNVLTYGYKFNYCSSCGAKMVNENE